MANCCYILRKVIYLCYGFTGFDTASFKPDIWRSDTNSACSSLIYFSPICCLVNFSTCNTIKPRRKVNKSQRWQTQYCLEETQFSFNRKSKTQWWNWASNWHWSFLFQWATNFHHWCASKKWFGMHTSVVAKSSSIRVIIIIINNSIYFFSSLWFLVYYLFIYFDWRCVPSKSTATIKLELLPLTDGIITLDSLQISVKEKGMYI